MSPSGVHLDTSGVAVPDRRELVDEAVAKGVNPIEIQYRQAENQAIDLRLNTNSFGPLAVLSLEASAMSARRTERLARDNSPPSLFVILKRAGSSRVVQDGRGAVVRPGDIVLVRSTQSSLMLSDHHNHQDSVQIPLQDLALPEPVLRQALAVCLGPELPLAGVLGRFIDSLTTVSQVRPVEAGHLARATVDLVRGVVTTLQGDDRPARDALANTLTLRVVDYLHTHWPEHDLTAEKVAFAHHISTRQLYRLLAAEGITLGQWLRERRLDASRDELARGGRDAVEAVGRRWGFADPTNFGRAFKAAYGVTPMQWRSLQHTAQR